MKISFFTGTIILLSILSSGCKRLRDNPPVETGVDSFSLPSEVQPAAKNVTGLKIENEEIVGDTIWICPYGSQTWHDTIARDDLTVYITAWTDTTDFLIDTVKSTLGSRIVVGYNHYYVLEFMKDNKSWFSVTFDKKTDLYPILFGTDFWQKSNLNIIDDIILNTKFERFIIELSVNSGDQINSMFYMIIDTEGTIDYLGTISSWGGGGPDGMPFLTQDEKMYITCDELYNFTLDTSISLTEYAIAAHVKSGIRSTEEYIQPHALRNLSFNNFLVIFNRFHNKPKYNAMILNTDTSVVGHFGYFGLIEDIDAILLFSEVEQLNKSFLYDSEREVLIGISNDSIPEIDETGLYEMIEFVTDSVTAPDVYPVEFGFYGPYEFYISPGDSVIYFKVTEPQI